MVADPDPLNQLDPNPLIKQQAFLLVAIPIP